MVLQERFWKEYEECFGEPELPMPDLGSRLIAVELSYNGFDGTVERFGIGGSGWTYDRDKPDSGQSRVETILRHMKKYNIEGHVYMERW